MPALPKPTEGGDFTPPPEGTFPAICCRIIDLGTQVRSFKGEEQHKHLVMLSWELKDDETIMEDGRPMTIHQRYTWSMHEKATLRRQLEAWLGRKFKESDFGPGGFDVRDLLGMPCLVSITHDEGREGKVFANVATITKLPKGMTAGSLINDKVFLWLEPGEFDQATYDSLSDGLKATIAKSPEYQQLMGRAPVQRKPAASHASPDIPGRVKANPYREQSQSSERPPWHDDMPPDDDQERWGPPRTDY
jgi:hypothetical protein